MREACARQMRAVPGGAPAAGYLTEAAQRLDALAAEVRRAKPHLQGTRSAPLGHIEERLFATSAAGTPEDDLLDPPATGQPGAELEPYRSRMQAVQIRQIERQFLHKRLLERLSRPRLSLFYMSQS